MLESGGALVLACCSPMQALHTTHLLTAYGRNLEHRLQPKEALPGCCRIRMQLDQRSLHGKPLFADSTSRVLESGKRTDSLTSAVRPCSTVLLRWQSDT